ncbi:NADH-quinone oxidoreductase subunit 5 family protein [Streptomyces xiamenensis]
MTVTTAAVLVPLLPALAAALIFLTGRRAPGFVQPLAVLPTLAAAGLAVFVAVRQGGEEPLTAAHRLAPTGNDSLPIELALRLDGFAVLVAVLVAVVATCVQLYSTGYLRGDRRYPSYAALVSLFTSAMLLVVYTDDLIVLLVGWEVMGICSYFLVGHYWETGAARAASLKAFLVTKLGDVPFLIGILALASDAGTFRISTIVTRLTSSLSSFELSHPTLIALLLLAGVAGKSAQVPLHTWLPDAMAGPTPASALIHAATMVAAGVYFIARLLPVFTASAAALIVLAVLAALTMTGSALAALAQDDIKRILAYSTIGQLGLMTGALAVANREAAVFHLLTHGAFKALLFLAAGVIIHTAGTGSLRALSRLRGLKERAPDAYWTMTIGLLALAAIPPFSGFFSKEAVIGAAEHAALDSGSGSASVAGWIVLAAALLTALLTAAYAARLWLVAFHDPVHARPEPLPAAAVHEDSTPVMTTVLWLLAVPALLLGLTYRALPDWLDGGSLAPTLTTSVLATAAALTGGLIMYAGWRRAYEADAAVDPGPALLGPLFAPAGAGFGLDTAYRTVFVRPTRAAATLVRFLDRTVIDTYVRGAATAPGLLGTLTRRAQTGNVQTYLAALIGGALVLAVAAVLVAAGG